MEPSHIHVGFLTFAEQFAAAASQTKKDTPVGGRLSLVGYFLFGHAIELGLKSFLLKGGYPANRVKAIGHDLALCLEEARKCSIDPGFLTPELLGSIGLLNEYYSKKEFEYFFQSKGMRLPEADSLEKAVGHLLQRLHALYLEGLRAESNAQVT